MKHARILFGLGVLLFSAAGAVAKPAYVATTVNLRAAPGTTSEIVAKIPGGSLVDTKDCTEGWCEVTWQDKSGFAIQTALDLSGRVPRTWRVHPIRRGHYVGRRRAGLRRAAAGLLLWRLLWRSLLPALLGLAPALVMKRQVVLSAPISKPSPTLTAR